MKNSVPEIFDRQLYLNRRERLLQNPKREDFLWRHMAESIDTSLQDVAYNFDKCLLTLPDPAIAEHMPTLMKKTQNRVIGGPTHNSFDIFLDEENMAIEAESFDLIISIGGLHVVNDLPGSLANYRRALKPNGLFLTVMVGGESLKELRQSFSQAEAECENGIKPHIHPFAELSDLAGLLQRAGFSLPVADTERLKIRYQNPLKLLHDLRLMGETNTLKARHKKFMRRETFFRAMEIYHDLFAEADGKVTARFDLHSLSGWAPHESQQKPLKPGIAKARLADALNTDEKKL